MVTIKGDKFIFFDVDDTLVMWFTQSDDLLAFNNYGTIEMLAPNPFCIAALKLAKKEGNTVVVWSGGGAEWAEEVVKVLNLEKYVDVVLAKPDEFHDDLAPDHFMRNRINSGALFHKKGNRYD